MPKVITITCQGAAMVPLATLEPFQDELKTLEENEYRKLKRAIEESGFSFPIFVWRADDGHHKVIDGHQRLSTVRQMMEEGYLLNGGKLPVAWIEADSEKDAKKKVFLAASQYGRYTEDSVHKFALESGLAFIDLKLEMDLPQISMDKLECCFEDLDITVLGANDPVPDRKDRAGSSPWTRVQGAAGVRCLIGDIEFTVQPEIYDLWIKDLASMDDIRGYLQLWLENAMR